MLETAPRNGYQQGKAADRGIEGDQGGHWIASIFNESGEALNLYPQNGNFNMGEWKQQETQWADALRDGKKVEVQVEAVILRGAHDLQISSPNTRSTGISRNVSSIIVQEANLEIVQHYQTIAREVHGAIGEPYTSAALNAQVEDDNCGFDLNYIDASGSSKNTGVDTIPSVRISDSLIALRQMMRQDGKEPWSRAVFTLTPDGKFNLDVSYDD